MFICGFYGCRASTSMVIAPKVCRSLREYGFVCPINISLSNKVPKAVIRALAESGVSTIMLDSTVSGKLDRKFLEIKRLGCKAGVSINLDVSAEEFTYHLPHIDIASICLNDISESMAIAYIRQVKEVSSSVELTVSGNLKKYDVAHLAKAGLDVFVLGKSDLCSGDHYTAIYEFKKEISFGRGA